MIKPGFISTGIRKRSQQTQTQKANGKKWYPENSQNIATFHPYPISNKTSCPAQSAVPRRMPATLEFPRRALQSAKGLLRCLTTNSQPIWYPSFIHKQWCIYIYIYVLILIVYIYIYSISIYIYHFPSLIIATYRNKIQHSMFHDA